MRDTVGEELVHVVKGFVAMFRNAKSTGPPAHSVGTCYRQGIEDALRRAKQAAGPKDVRLGGGVDTIRQYLRAGLVDELHLAFSPVLLGLGEHLLSGLDLPGLGYRVTQHVASEAALHVVLARG